jgi:predicted nucleic acid-binding protein
VSGWLLDTNVISELRKPRPSARVSRFIASQRLEDLFVSPVASLRAERSGAVVDLQFGADIP